MNRTIIIRPAALSDLASIWRYTTSSWGKDQADAYIVAIDREIARLAEVPGTGSDRGNIRPGLRKIRSQRHSIYYYHDEQTLRIARVLHVSMDASRDSFDDQ